MKRIVLTFGLIAGAIFAAMMAVTMPLHDKIGPDRGLIIGYTTMVLAFLLVFFGIRSYRETVGNGQISFLRALGVGLLIMTIASICYVATWEIIYFNFMGDYVDKYVAQAIEKVRASGKSPAQMEMEIENMRSMMNLYKSNFLFNIAITFLEPLPVGLPMTIISALILRKRKRASQDYQDLQDLQDRPNPV